MPRVKSAKAVSARIAGWLLNTLLALASCLAALLAFEAGLRWFHPHYQHLADAGFILDPNSFWVRIPNHRTNIAHPDTDERLLLLHNGFGARQHRNFSQADLESSVNIAFFGDSFTENRRMAAQFSFTEPLDYLLNLSAGSQSLGAYNVLNFGVERYAMSQSVLRYETWRFREALDHVFYVYYDNDLPDDYGRGLFRLDEAGQLVRVDRRPSVVSALLSQLHLSYLALDAAGRLQTHLHSLVAKSNDFRRHRPRRRQVLPSGAHALFRQQVRRFRAAAEESGASFHWVWLPMEDYDTHGAAAIVRGEGIEEINLRDCFGVHNATHLDTLWLDSPYRFVTDKHWNEAGNRLAAVCLLRHLQGQLGLARLSEEQVDRALQRYYSAFEVPPGETAQAADPALAAIRDRYTALERVLRGGDLYGRSPPWTPTPDKLVIRSRFDVYLHDGWLAYVKEGCAPADFDLPFFLHLVPVDVEDLPPHRLTIGFDNLDFHEPHHDPQTCTVWRKLPRYPIERIRTGQYSGDSQSGFQSRWESEHILTPG